MSNGNAYLNYTTAQLDEAIGKVLNSASGTINEYVIDGELDHGIAVVNLPDGYNTERFMNSFKGGYLQIISAVSVEFFAVYPLSETDEYFVAQSLSSSYSTFLHYEGFYVGAGELEWVIDESMVTTWSAFQMHLFLEG